MHSLFDIQSFLLDVIKNAGDIMMEGQGKNISIDHKSSVNDLVTEYDIKVEKYITSRITEEFPDHGILGEEEGQNDNKSDYLWIIDPIDGTVNYAHHIPFFCCSIALLYQGETILGAIYNPVTQELFHAMKNEGAYLNSNKIGVSPQKEFLKSLLVTGFSYQATQSSITFPLFEKIVSQNIPIRRLGSAALDLAYVACGRFEGFWEEGLKPWDIAAGYLMVMEAGGQVTDFNNVTADLKQSSTWASNGHIHQEFIDNLQTLNFSKKDF